VRSIALQSDRRRRQRLACVRSLRGDSNHGTALRRGARARANRAKNAFYPRTTVGETPPHRFFHDGKFICCCCCCCCCYYCVVQHVVLRNNIPVLERRSGNVRNASKHRQIIKVKVKVHTLDIALLRSESPLQKRSGMARVFKGFHSFTCTPTRSSAIGMSHKTQL